MGPLALMFVALGAADATRPVVQVIAVDQPPAVEAARQLHQGMRQDGRLSVPGEVIVAGPKAAAVDLEPARSAIELAAAKYVALDAAAALELAGPVRSSLSLHLDDPAAVQLLARTYRVLGLAHLYEGRNVEASRTFGIAAALDPEFSPNLETWPPAARLAYADAVAERRMEGEGVLTLDVEPRAAAVWLDGKRVGTGPTTLRKLVPGEHLLLATAPGFEPVSAVVDVEGGDKLNETSLFLAPKPPEAARGERIAAAAAAVDGPDEASAAALAAQELSADALLVVGLGTAGARRAWALDRQGARLGEPLDLTAPHAATSVVGRVLGEPVITQPIAPPEPLEPERPWYAMWEVWTAVGAVVAGAAAITTGVLVSEARQSLIYLYTGGPR